MSILCIGAWLMLVSGGLWAGGLLIFAVERTNLWRRMPIEQYALDFRRSLYRVDPLLPILAVLSCAGATAFAIGSNGRAQFLGWTGVALIALVILSSIVIAEPINSKFRGLREGQVPAGAERYRTRWRCFHAIRNIIAIVGFACLAAAAV
ncbi:MAG: DUF1772 domain-containing protein [Pseudonocardiaceae bacterium]